MTGGDLKVWELLGVMGGDLKVWEWVLGDADGALEEDGGDRPTLMSSSFSSRSMSSSLTVALASIGEGFALAWGGTGAWGFEIEGLSRSWNIFEIWSSTEAGWEMGHSGSVLGNKKENKKEAQKKKERKVPDGDRTCGL